MKISIYIKQVRKKLNLTQKEFAEILGKERCSVTNYEIGRAKPRADTLLKIQKLESEHTTAQ